VTRDDTCYNWLNGNVFACAAMEKEKIHAQLQEARLADDQAKVDTLEVSEEGCQPAQ